MIEYYIKLRKKAMHAEPKRQKKLANRLYRELVRELYKQVQGTTLITLQAKMPTELGRQIISEFARFLGLYESNILCKDEMIKRVPLDYKESRQSSILSYDEWLDKYCRAINAELEKDGINEDSAFDYEREYEKRYDAYLRSITGVGSVQLQSISEAAQLLPDS